MMFVSPTGCPLDAGFGEGVAPASNTVRTSLDKLLGGAFPEILLPCRQGKTAFASLL